MSLFSSGIPRLVRFSPKAMADDPAPIRPVAKSILMEASDTDLLLLSQLQAACQPAKEA